MGAQPKLPKRLHIPLILVGILIMIGVYPGSGGEGAQREITNFQSKLDWWNFLTAFIYGKWPTTFDNWQFSLTILQLVCYLIGIRFFLNSLSTTRYKFVFLAPAILGSYFVIQLWRDASLFAYSVLAISLVTNTQDMSRKKRVIRISSSLLLLIFSSLFKPIFAPINFLIFFYLISELLGSKFKKIVTFLCLLLLSCMPLIFDRYLSSASGLTKSYPEQQVYLYDISKMYCWGFSPEVVEKSQKALLPFMTSSESKESVCTSLSPTGWDSLRVKLDGIAASPALRTISESEESKLSSLRSSWLNLIFMNPTEWLLVKVSDTAQVLTMANAFYMPGIFENSSNLFLLDLADFAIKILLVPIQILDKFRIFSIGTALIIGVTALYWNKNRSKLSRSRQAIIVRFLAINCFTLILATMAYIANNGRYIMPYLLLSYLYLIWGFGSIRNTKVK